MIFKKSEGNKAISHVCSLVVGYKVRKVSKKPYQPVNLTIFAQIVNEIQITWDEYS